MGLSPIKHVFRGVTQLSLDAKGRMVMPTRYRDRLQERCGGHLIGTVDKDHCLLLYPLPDWEEIERKLMRLPSFNAHARRLQRLMVGYATELDLDSHGRLLLPGELRSFASLTRDAVLLGQGNRFELWDEARWTENRDAWLGDESIPADLPADLESLSL
jgi:MraZ protein